MNQRQRNQSTSTQTPTQIVDNHGFRLAATRAAFLEAFRQELSDQYRIVRTPTKFVSLPDENGVAWCTCGERSAITFYGHHLYVVRITEDHWSINLVRSTIDFWMLKNGWIDIAEPYWRTPISTIIWYMSNVEATMKEIAHTSYLSPYKPGSYPRQLLAMLGAEDR